MPRDRGRHRRSSAPACGGSLTTLGGVAAAAALLITFGPAFLRSGMSALLIISRSAEAASPYKIDVTPGNTKIPRGADQTVKAKLLGLHRPATRR